MSTYDVRTDAAVGVDAAVGALRRGELVVLPTDTVYGVAADAFSPSAVGRLLQARASGRGVPVPVLVGSWRTLDGLAEHVPPLARRLVEAFWPGPLTLVVRAAPSLAWDLGDSRGTVAVRMPLHPVALQVLEQTGPLAVTGACRPGTPPVVDSDTAREQLGTAVAAYLDAGPLGAAVPSTVVDLTTDAPRLLRAGALHVGRLREVLPELLVPLPPPAPDAPPPAGAPPPDELPHQRDEPGEPR